MLYQLSYTPRPVAEVASGARGRKGGGRCGGSMRPLPRCEREGQRTIGNPTQLPFVPVNTRCVAAR